MELNKFDIYEKIGEIYNDRFSYQNYGELSLDADLKEDLQMDSLDRIEFVLNIEDAFDISIHDEDIERFKTVENIIDCIFNLKKQEK